MACGAGCTTAQLCQGNSCVRKCPSEEPDGLSCVGVPCYTQSGRYCVCVIEYLEPQFAPQWTPVDPDAEVQKLPPGYRSWQCDLAL